MPDPCRSICQDACAEFGDPPCYEIVADWKPCGECLVAAGVEVPEPIDPSAVVKDMFV